jgi:ferric-dicitrate binding protein FerR (iron transport regulator)
MKKTFSKEDARELLKRYRLGQCTAKELEIIDRWYHSFDSNSVNEADLAEGGRLDDLKAQMFESITGTIADMSEGRRLTGQMAPIPTRQVFFNFTTISRVAAVLLVGVSAGIFIYTQLPRLLSGRGVAPKTSGAETTASKIAEVATPSTVYLSDGTVVWLKEGSKLHYPETFKGNLREVRLAGEAFFDVAKDPERPFVIHAPNFTTRVLGTSFNIKAYRNDDVQEVVVVTGRVVVSLSNPPSGEEKQLVLHPNEKARYTKKDNSLIESTAPESAKHIAADKRKLAFDETRLEDIVNVLNTTYGVSISLSTDRMKECVVTADLTDEHLEVDLAVLSKAVNATYTIQGKDIMLIGNGCGAQP